MTPFKVFSLRKARKYVYTINAEVHSIPLKKRKKNGIQNQMQMADCVYAVQANKWKWNERMRK